MNLRPYQDEAIEAFRKARKGANNRFLITAATGAGKTIIASSIMQEETRQRKGHCLFLVHRDELIRQTVDKLRKVDDTLRVGVIKAAQDDWGEDFDISVASVQSISRVKRLTRYPKDLFSLIIVDETHRVVARSYQTTLRYFGVYDHNSPTTTLLGITATATRTDGTSLDTVFQEHVFSIGLEELIRRGSLVPIRALSIQTNADLSGVRKKAGDFDERELASLLNVANRNDIIAEALKKYAAGRRTVAFCANIEHAEDLAHTLRKHGIAAESVHSKLTDTERKSRLAQFHDGELQAITSAQLLVEGWDEPLVDCVLWASPTMSAIKFAQGVGRGTRLSPETRKEHLLVIDCADNCGKHAKSLQSVASLFDMGEAGARVLAAGMDALEAKAVDDEEKKHQEEREAREAEMVRLFGKDAHAYEVDLFEPDAEIPHALAVTHQPWFAIGRKRFILPMVRKQAHIFREGEGGDRWRARIYREREDSYDSWELERDVCSGSLAECCVRMASMIEQNYRPAIAGLRTMKQAAPSDGQIRKCGDQRPQTKFDAFIIIAQRKARLRYMGKRKMAA